MEFLIQVDKKIYEISELVKSVSYTDKLNDGCGKLEFSLIDDDLKLENSSIVSFKYDGTGIFYGVVFKHSRNSKGEITVTAYDQLRYCKAKDTIVVRNNTVTDMVKKMCTFFSLRMGTLSDAAYVLATKVHSDKTWLDIVYDGISDTLVNKDIWFSLRDEFGYVALRNLADLKLNLVLGDSSLCYEYDYEKSIDDTFYNRIKLVSKNEKTKKADVYITKDSASIQKYGLLQYYEVMSENANYSKAKAKANALLKLYNRESEKLNMECLGDVNVRAGSSFYGQIEDIGIENKRLIVRSVTHDFLPVHTMSLEVAL